MNIVILMNDQHAHDVLGCAGFGTLKTPAADRLARDGIRFTEATCAVIPCLPSRHSLFHGLCAWQTGIYSNGHLMRPEDVPSFTMGRVFKAAGYHTAAYGKMHWFPYPARMARGSYFGFDHRAGHFHETGETMESHFIAEHREWAVRRHAEHEARKIPKGGDSCAAAFVGYVSDLRNNERADWWSAHRAAEFIAAHADQPFLVVCSMEAPHAPHEVPRDFAGLYSPEAAPLPPEPPYDLPMPRFYADVETLTRRDVSIATAHYMGLVHATDACHLQVLEALDRHGLYDETLILYLSDHGELLGSRGPKAWSKYNLYERAVRVPLVIKPPKSFSACPRNATSGLLVSLLDILPTVLDAVGLRVDPQLPGISLKPIFEGKLPARQRAAAVTEFAGRERVNVSIRSRDWKLILGPFGEELYHLAEDPWEFQNLAGDPALALKKAELRAQYIEETQQAFLRQGARALAYPRQDWDPLSR